MKQQGSYPTGCPITKACFSQPTSNMEPLKQILDMEKTSRSNVVETSRLNHTEKLNQVRYLEFADKKTPKNVFKLNGY